MLRDGVTAKAQDEEVAEEVERARMLRVDENLGRAAGTARGDDRPRANRVLVEQHLHCRLHCVALWCGVGPCTLHGALHGALHRALRPYTVRL